MSALREGTKLVADTAAGVTIAEVNDQNSLIITLVTIISRLILEVIINRKMRKNGRNPGE